LFASVEPGTAQTLVRSRSPSLPSVQLVPGFFSQPHCFTKSHSPPGNDGWQQSTTSLSSAHKPEPRDSSQTPSVAGQLDNGATQ
jgi:hypothetical protein